MKNSKIYVTIKNNCSNILLEVLNQDYYLDMHFQGRRQDFVKGGADARYEMQTPLWLGSWGCQGVWVHKEPMTTCSWNDWFNFLSLLVLLFSFFFFSLSFPLLSPLFSSLFFFFFGGRGGLQPP